LILFLHSRYRIPGGEERAVADLMWLVREQWGEEAELLSRDASLMGRRRAAAGLLLGGLRPDDVYRAVRRTGARVLHAHNLNPTFGWRALAAAKEAGARVVLHLHQYRLVCAVGVCFTRGEECTRCHGRNTLPGAVLACRGARTEAAVYGAGLALWQRRLVSQADAVVVPSRSAAQRLQSLGAPVNAPHVLRHIMREFASQSLASAGRYALLASRLVPEKGIEVAIEACRLADIPLVIAGEGPERARLQGTADGVTFAGQVDDAGLRELRRGAAIGLVPSRFAETFGLAAAEAMAAGLPVAASRIGALPELVPAEWLAPPGDAPALATTIRRLARDAQAGEAAIARARAVTSAEVVGPALAAIYGD
jgi:glycosyltransferase involved in cell wall biosynthesis